MSVTTEFKAGGLHCSSCSMLITMNLEEICGVESVKCDHATGLTQVTYDFGAITAEDIIHAIEAAGYTAEQVAGKGC